VTLQDFVADRPCSIRTDAGEHLLSPLSSLHASLFSTYASRTYHSLFSAVALDQNNNAYVAGLTDAGDFSSFGVRP
jgi:hypothetical protein